MQATVNRLLEIFLQLNREGHGDEVVRIAMDDKIRDISIVSFFVHKSDRSQQVVIGDDSIEKQTMEFMRKEEEEKFKRENGENVIQFKPNNRP